MPNDTEAEKLSLRLNGLKKHREVLDWHCQEIARRILPRQAEFLYHPTPGEKRTELVFDYTGALALERYAAAMESMLTPRVSRWHGLKNPNRDLNKLRSVKLWYEQLTHVLFAQRYSPKANFAAQQAELYMSLGAFGTAPKIVDGRKSGGIRYKSLHLSRCFTAYDYEGNLDTFFYEEPPLTYRQLADHFGYKNLSDHMRKALKEGDYDKQADIVHAVFPNKDRVHGRMDATGKKYRSVYYEKKENHILAIGGYNTMPYMAPRASVAPTETYGRSPAMLVLPGLKMLNEMKKTNIRAGHMAVLPPLLTADNAILRPDYRPAAVNRGGLSASGQDMVKPMITGAAPDTGEALMEVERETINDAFFVTLFQILVDNHTMTATEVMERAREKAALIAPAMARQQTEDIDPMIEREIDILVQQRKIPPPPPELVEAGMEYEVEHTSPLSRTMRSEEAVGFFRTMEGLTPLAQIKPSVLDIFDEDQIGYGLAEINGVPESWLKDKNALKRQRDGQAQAQQSAALLEAAPVVTQAQKTAAETQEIEARRVV